MIVDRRTFVAGAACVAVAPVTQLLPSAFATPELTGVQPPVFKISGLECRRCSRPEQCALDECWVRMEDCLAVARSTASLLQRLDHF